jgi:hypothetical protein
MIIRALTHLVAQPVQNLTCYLSSGLNRMSSRVVFPCSYGLGLVHHTQIRFSLTDLTYFDIKRKILMN